MTNVYVEARPKGRREGDPIDDLSLRSCGPCTRHHQDAAKRHGHSPLVARVRHLNNKKKTRPLARCLGRVDGLSQV